MPGIPGQSFDFQVTFRENGILFDPYSVQDVKIYTSDVGGSVVATLTPVQVSAGVWRCTWNIPASQPSGIYYDEWTWDATNTSGTKVQRYSLEVISTPAVPEEQPPSLIATPKLAKLKGGNNLAVGYWGRDISGRIDAEQSPQKIRVLLQDKLLSRGKNVYLWQQVTVDTPNSIQCSCVKNTTERPDITCYSCYGVKLIPGYIKFAHETLFLASISPNTFLEDVQIDTEIKPHRILIANNKLSGSFTSPKLFYSNPLNADWDIRCDAANIKESNLILCLFSTDGVKFHPIDEINTPGLKPTGNGFIILRVTMARADVNDRSPEFQIVRVRHPIAVEPFIKVLRPQVTENPTWVSYGKRVEHIGEAFWTAPLDFFDCNIPANTPSARILENSFYQRVDGINSDSRYVMTKLRYNEEFGIFTHQSFETRRTQEEEMYNALVF